MDTRKRFELYRHKSHSYEVTTANLKLIVIDSFNTLFNILLKEAPKTESLLIKKCQGAFKVPLGDLLSPDLIEDDIITTPEEKEEDTQLVSKTETAIVKRKPGKLSKIIGLFKFVKMLLDGGHSFISLLVLILVWKTRKTLQ